MHHSMPSLMLQSRVGGGRLPGPAVGVLAAGIAGYRRFAAAIRPVGKGVPTLKQFILRGRVLGLYREILRTLRHISTTNPILLHELRAYARGEFERNKSVREESRIRFLLSTGRQELNQMRRYIGEE
ncbi:hypothetical protein BDZ91DRAFT_77671 [Kalaharituber pfeilii]|nr:hypothetical protein BDZ91DRAFT_77671 [Kalaharituber pfeilii]